jgi:hypothetical protein
MDDDTAHVTCIKCKWMDEKRIVVNTDGQVLPCCYFANMVYFSTVNTAQGTELPDGHKVQMAHPVLKSYVDSAEAHNIFETGMETILDSEWYTKTLPESWENPQEDAHYLCKLMCGS